MPGLSISDVARRFGLRPSALRYYEQIGIISPPPRSGGQRRYDATALHRLAVVQRGRQLGFTLAEILELFVGFQAETAASERWQRLSARKLAELDATLARIKSMKRLLRRMQRCGCRTLEQCGKGMFERACEGKR